MKIFVYGTLMKGFYNERIMKQIEAKFISKAVITGYDLYKLNGWLPVIIPQESEDVWGVAVHGEVYEVPDRWIPDLDRFECQYNRIEVYASWERKAIKNVQGYVFKDLKFIKDGKWKGE